MALPQWHMGGWGDLTWSKHRSLFCSSQDLGHAAASSGIPIVLMGLLYAYLNEQMSMLTFQREREMEMERLTERWRGREGWREREGRGWNEIYFLFMSMRVKVCMCMSACKVCEGYKRVSESLELQVATSCLMLVLRSKPRFSGRAL